MEHLHLQLQAAEEARRSQLLKIGWCQAALRKLLSQLLVVVERAAAEHAPSVLLLTLALDLVAAPVKSACIHLR